MTWQFALGGGEVGLRHAKNEVLDTGLGESRVPEYCE